MKSHQKQFRIRLRWLFYVFIPLGCLILVGNLFNLQIQHGTYFREQADNQYVVSSYNAFKRGEIYFTEKGGDLIMAAGQEKGYKVAVNPSHIDDPEALYESIRAIASPTDSKESFIRQASSDRTYYEVVNDINTETAQKIKEILGSTVQLYSEKWRVYPLDSVGAHTLGFLAYQGDEYAGRYGLERYYEKTLIRTDKDVYTNFFARIFHDVQDVVDADTKLEGDLITTIEPQVQIYLEDTLLDVQTTWNSEGTGGIVIHPQTGEIYAMASVPTFNPNDFSEESLSTFKNPLVENVYEFGSVLKPLVVAAALDTGDIDENTTYYDKGSVVVGEHTIYNFDKEGRGLVDVQEILNQSLNTGMVYISSLIDKEDFRTYFTKYGFKETTGIDLPNETTGLTNNLKSNRDIEFANMSFGQGIAISPIAMVKAMTAITNGGETVVPHVVQKIRYENGLSASPQLDGESRQAITSETASEVSRMMVNVFDAYNNGSTKIPHYSIAAKTGTAQIPSPDGSYYDNRHLHSFVGFFPAYDPQFLVFLYTIYPKNVRYSSQTLLEPFRDTVQYLINYYDVPPDR